MSGTTSRLSLMSFSFVFIYYFFSNSFPSYLPRFISSFLMTFSLSSSSLSISPHFFPLTTFSSLPPSLPSIPFPSLPHSFLPSFSSSPFSPPRLPRPSRRRTHPSKVMKCITLLRGCRGGGWEVAGEGGEEKGGEGKGGGHIYRPLLCTRLPKW